MNVRRGADDAPTVVLAAPSPTVGRVLGSVLGRAGFAVTAVGDGVAAARAALAGSARIVVAWADLPRLSGFALTRLLRDDPRTAALPVVLLTAPEQADERFWAERCGADRALPSDVESHQLVETLRAVLDAAGAEAGIAGDAAGPADDEVLSRATAVLERVLFETALVAEVTALATAGLGAEGATAALLSTVARTADPAFAALITPAPPLALVLVNRPVSRAHYRDLLLRLAADAGRARNTALDASSVDARAADPQRLLGSDEEAHLAYYESVALTGADGAYVGHLAITSGEEPFSERVLHTVETLAEPAGRLVGTVTGVSTRA